MLIIVVTLVIISILSFDIVFVVGWAYRQCLDYFSNLSLLTTSLALSSCACLAHTILIVIFDSFIDYEGPDKPKPDFFSSAMRSRMVHEILLRTRYGEEQQQFGKIRPICGMSLLYTCACI